MPTRNAPVTQADFDALAALANANLLPLVNAAVATNSWPMHEYDYQYDQYPQVVQPAYDFPPNNQLISSPANVQGAIVYGFASYPAENITLSIKVYAYKTIGGRKSYCLLGSPASVTSDNSYPNTFKVEWSWLAPSGGADGYIVEQCTLNAPKSWTDVGNVLTWEDTGFPPSRPYHNPMSWMTTLNRIRGDYWNLIMNGGLGADAVHFSADNILSGPWIVGVNDEDTFPKGGFPPGVSSLQIPAPNYPLDFVKLTGELIGALNANFVCYKGVQFCYAENDAPDGMTIGVGQRVDFGWAGLSTTPSISYVCDLAGHWTCQVWWIFTWTGGGAAPDAPPDASGFTVTATPGTGITWSTAKLCPYMNQVIPGNPAYGPVNSGVYALIATIEMDITAGSQTIDFNVSASPANYTLSSGPLVTSRLIFATADMPVPISAVHPTSPCLVITAPDMPGGSDFSINGNDGIAFWNIDQPDVKGVWIAKTLPVPGNNVFIDQDMPPYVGATAGEVYHGTPIAVSESLCAVNQPLNEYNYVDNPPTDQIENDFPRFTTSMRQQALLQSGDLIIVFMGVPGYPDGYPVDMGPKYNLITQSCQHQPAQWLFMRDTDQMPWTWGTWGNPNQNFSIYENVNLGAGQTSNGALSCPANATAVKLKLRQVSPKNGGVKIFDGGDLTSALNIYVSKSGFPNPSVPASYDFVTGNNAVTIDGTGASDGGAGYLATIVNGGFNYLVKNPTGATVAFDLIVEIDTGAVPRELQFLPDVNECYSFTIDGTPPGYTMFYTIGSNYPSYIGLKPVPQSGYCIFNVKAKRLPVLNDAGISVMPSSGAELHVSIGQNKLQYDGTWAFEPFFNFNGGIGAGSTTGGGAGSGGGAGGDGTPFTLTIPANAADSGDVEVFIPVLHGAPLVWQGDDCVVEAWANWQPIFFSTGYGFTNFYINMDINYVTDFTPTAFQFCLAFTNFFNPLQNNTPDDYGTDVYGAPAGTHVTFPMSKEIYDDLTACLNLL